MQYFFYVILITILLPLSSYATCSQYFLCPYEVEGNERRMPFYLQKFEGFEWREIEVEGNQAIVCVTGRRPAPFVNWGCVELSNREQALGYLSQPRSTPYMDNGVMKFKDGFDGRPLNKQPVGQDMLDKIEEKLLNKGGKR